MPAHSGRLEGKVKMGNQREFSDEELELMIRALKEMAFLYYERVDYEYDELKAKCYADDSADLDKIIEYLASGVRPSGKEKKGKET